MSICLFEESTQFLTGTLSVGLMLIEAVGKNKAQVVVCGIKPGIELKSTTEMRDCPGTLALAISLLPR